MRMMSELLRRDRTPAEVMLVLTAWERTYANAE